ncbi:MAG: pirin family protein [Verrucomicrobiales bacterium]
MTAILESPTANVRRADERGHADHGWLKTWHSFSFADYYDPAHMGYRSLRVINDDFIAPGKGFGMHPHRSMEIFTYIISGRLEHKDSMGNGRVIETGQFQYMSAGSGVYHSEFNPSEDEEVHLLQIWITPEVPGGEPRYADMDTTALKRDGGLALFASPDGRGGSMPIRQNAEIHFGKALPGEALVIPADAERSHAWLHLISGAAMIGGAALSPGDSCAILSPGTISVSATEPSEFLLFRLA